MPSALQPGDSLDHNKYRILRQLGRGGCGFAYGEHGECPRCKLALQAQAPERLDTGERRSVLDQVRDLLAGLNDDTGEG